LASKVVYEGAQKLDCLYERIADKSYTTPYFHVKLRNVYM